MFLQPCKECSLKALHDSLLASVQGSFPNLALIWDFIDFSISSNISKQEIGFPNARGFLGTWYERWVGNSFKSTPSSSSSFVRTAGRWVAAGDPKALHPKVNTIK